MRRNKPRIRRIGPLGRPSRLRYKTPEYYWTVFWPQGTRGLRMSFRTWREAVDWTLKMLKQYHRSGE